MKTNGLAKSPLLAACAGLLASCGAEPAGVLPGDSGDTRPYAGVSENEAIHLTGTEPFWGGDVVGGTFSYSTPENIDGTPIAVSRFAGRGGVSFSGELDGRSVDLAVTPGECSDGMSDRTYPFVATLKLGEETRNGCAWTDAQMYEGGPA